MGPYKEMFKKYGHQYHSLSKTFQNNTKVRMTHFNISVNAAEVIMAFCLQSGNSFHVLPLHKNASAKGKNYFLLASTSLQMFVIIQN